MLALTLSIITLAASAAYAAAPRPNALDRAVDVIPDARLLHESARALADPDRAKAATRLAQLMLPGWFVTIGIQIIGLAYFWQSGLAARVRDWLRRRLRSRFSVRYYMGAGIALVARALALIPDFYVYRISRAMGLSDALLRSWSVDWLVNTVITMALAGVVVAVVLWLVERTPRWYLYTIAAIIFVNIALSVVAPILVLPRFGSYVPLPQPYAADAQRLEARAHVDVPIYEHVRDRTHLGSAYVDGLGPTQRIIVADSVLQSGSRREVAYVIAREIGYVAIGGPVRVALLDSLFTIIGIALAVTIADRIGFRRDDDPLARVALVAALLGVMFLAIVPFDNASLRQLSDASEEDAIQLTGDRAVAVRNIIRNADQDLSPICRSRAASFFLGEYQDPARAVEIANNVPAGC